jgi:hypothetical protein
MAATSQVSSNDQDKKGLTHWRKQLLQVSLPALGRTGHELTQMLKKADCALSDLEKIIAEDPVLAFQILSHANKLSTNPDNDVMSLPHAMSLMGMDKLRPVLKNIKYIHFSPLKTAHNAFLQALNTSLHAASLAASWAEKKIPGSGEASYWMTLRLSSVYWYLSLASPKSYHAIEQRVQLGESRSHVEQDILGCTCQQLTQSMLPYWRLSKFTTNNLSQLLTPKPRMLGKLTRCAWITNVAPETPKAQGVFMQTPGFGAVLAHSLALNSAVSWYSQQTLRTLKIVSAYLHQPLEEVIVQVHKDAIRYTRAHGLPGLWSPAVKLLHPPLPKRSVPKKLQRSEQLKPSPQSIDQSKAQRAKAKKDLSVDNRKKAVLKPIRAEHAKLAPEKKELQPLSEVQTALFKLFYMQTVKQHQVFSIHQLMDGASQVLHFDLGLTRCILFMKSRSKKGAVKGVYAKGFEDNSPFAVMEVDAEIEHLFGKLMNKPSALWVTPQKIKKLSGEIPAELWQTLDNPNEFMLATVSVRGMASGILYADNKGGDKEMSQSYYNTFRSVSQAINHGLGTLSGRKDKSPKR